MDEQTTLADLLALNLHEFEDEVKNIVDKAVKEMSMEKVLKVRLRGGGGSRGWRRGERGGERYRHSSIRQDAGLGMVAPHEDWHW